MRFPKLFRVEPSMGLGGDQSYCPDIARRGLVGLVAEKAGGRPCPSREKRKETSGWRGEEEGKMWGEAQRAGRRARA